MYTACAHLHNSPVWVSTVLDMLCGEIHRNAT